MPTQVRLPTAFRSLAGGHRTVCCAGATVGTLLADLQARYPLLRERLGTGAGALGMSFDVLVNGVDTRCTGGLATPVADGESVVILPRLAGD